jgi:hypothetical protein
MYRGELIDIPEAIIVHRTWGILKYTKVGNDIIPDEEGTKELARHINCPYDDSHIHYDPYKKELI